MRCEPLPLRRAVNLGLIAGGLAAFVGWLESLAGGPNPFELSAEGIMARTPPALANSLLTALGPLARPAALLGAVALLLALSVAASIPMAAPLTSGLRLALSALSTLAAATLASFWIGLSQPGWICVALALPLVWLLAGMAMTPKQQPGTSRRKMLTGSVVAAAVVLIAANAVFLDAVARALRPVKAAGVRLFAWSAPAARASGFDSLPGVTPEVTPVDHFYVMSKNVDDPSLSADAWTLRVGGRVARPQRFTYARLLALPRGDVYATLRCISNDISGQLMSTALFSGVSLASLLALATPAADADTVVLRAIDGHSDSISLSEALHPATLVAYAMNGQALGRRHGFPARSLTPGLYGFKQVKWLTEIELIRGPYTGHWQQLGWTATAVVHPVARIDTVRPTGHGVVVAGVAYTGARGVSAVQVRVNGGPWLPSVLNVPPLSEFSWVQWRAGLQATSGTLEARVIDGGGKAQDETPHSLYPDGATGLHRIHFDTGG